MNLLFPHEQFREVQEVMIQDLMEALENKNHILVHAPTGLGKTASVLTATLSYVLEKGKDKTIFFLTSKHTQHKIAMETISLIKKKYNLDFKVADFIGKKWMCLQPNVQDLSSSEFYEFCKKVVDKNVCMYYNNLKENEKLSLNARITLEKIEEGTLNVNQVIDICSENSVCPYEINALHAQKSKVIIADYHHILSPGIRDHLFKKIHKDLSNCILIFDEAHNLASRIRDLMTVNLSTFIINASKREAVSLGFKEISEDIDSLNQILEELSRKIPDEENEVLITKNEFVKKLIEFTEYKELIGSLVFVGQQILQTKRRSFCNSLAGFLQQWLGKDEGFARILTKGLDKKGYTSINLSYRCLDPSFIMKDIAEEALVIGMSGTLNPLEMHRDLLGIQAELKVYNDPFPKHNRLNLIIPKTTTKFTFRDEDMYNKIAVVTSSLVNNIDGNSAVFFPSYQLRDKVNFYFQNLCEKTTFLEQQGLSKLERENILENFKSYKDSGAVLLATTSGSFGEGIDLPGDFLKAVIIVGLPLSKQDLETKELIKYYDARFNKGWDYGYLFPAMIKCIQSAGRCIRSKDDKGVIIFLDERYKWKNYSRCFPKDWEFKTTVNPIPLIKEFFENNKE